jgi:hypothetical protein
MSDYLNLPELSDKELENLHGNAIRLSQSGSQLQKARAEEMLPRVGAEIARRRTAHVAAVNRKRESMLASRKAVAKKPAGKTRK